MSRIRALFPIFSHRKPFIYLDTAATAQKPQSVIDAISKYYAADCANVHRAVYEIAEHATEKYEGVRGHVARFIGAQPNEIIFTRGTTDGINLVAQTWGREHITPGSQIVITALEHHANLLPWQVLCKEKGAELVVIQVTKDSLLDMAHAEKVIGPKTKLVAAVHSSNFTGTHIDIAAIAHMAHAVGAKILVDAAQSVVHEPISVTDLHADFLVFSGHKLYGPTGVGVLFAKHELLAHMPPYQYGGSMVYEADYHHATWQKPPRKFEAGTPPIAEVIGLGAAISFVESLDRKVVASHEAELCSQLIDGLQKIKTMKIIGPVEELKTRGHLVSFVMDGIHPHDVAAHLDRYGICVRAGHQCAQPLAKRLELDSAVRVSFGCYNTAEDVELVVQALKSL